MTDTRVVSGILQGDYDRDLEGMADAIAERLRIQRRINGAIVAAGFSIGDKVRFNSRVSPGYLVGVTGTIHSKKVKRFIVKIDPGQYTGKFVSDKITASAEILEKVKD